MFWDFGIGGIQTRLLAVMSSILVRYPSARITLLLKRKSEHDRELPQSARFRVRYYSEAAYRGRQGRYMLWLLQQLIELQPTHILSLLNRFTLVAVICSRLLRLRGKAAPRVVINQAVYTSTYIAQYERPYWHLLVAVTYRLADAIIVPTMAMRHDLTSRYLIPASRITVVPSWVKPVPLRPVGKRYDAVFVGRLAPEKRIDQILAMAQQIRRQRLRLRIGVFGDGELRGWLEQRIRELKLEKTIIYRGFHPEPIREIRHSRALLLPSMNEGLPMVVLEAASVGVPAILHDFAGAEEIVGQETTGWIFREEQYAASAVALLRQPAVLREAGVRARRYVRQAHSLRQLDRFTAVLLGIS